MSHNYDICREDGESYCFMGLDYCRTHGCYDKAKQLHDLGLFKKDNRQSRRAQKGKSKFKKKYGGK